MFPLLWGRADGHQTGRLCTGFRNLRRRAPESALKLSSAGARGLSRPSQPLADARRACGSATLPPPRLQQHADAAPQPHFRSKILWACARDRAQIHEILPLVNSTTYGCSTGTCWSCSGTRCPQCRHAAHTHSSHIQQRLIRHRSHMEKTLGSVPTLLRWRPLVQSFVRSYGNAQAVALSRAPPLGPAALRDSMRDCLAC